MHRTVPIDLLRGFIMILMALDHASAMVARVHFMEIWGYPFEGYDTFTWWFTRFVSHLCAPGFFFLMGMSIYLFSQKRLSQGWDDSKIRAYFFKRGALILLLMFLLEFPAWGLSNFFKQMPPSSEGFPLPGYFEGGFLIPTTVLYGLGMCMIIAAFLWRLKKEWLLLITVLNFAFSTWYVGQLSSTDVLNPLAVFAFVPGVSVGAMTLYPIVPWLGVTTFGLFWAKLFQEKEEKPYRLALFTGLVFVGLFVIIRFLEWGNFQLNSYHDWITFFTLVKYPPSIPFFFITCGINLILLFVFSKMAHLPFLKPIKLFGQTAMFFYILHLYVYALLGAFFPLGCAIEVMYLLWIIGLIPLYFICRWFLNFKKNKPSLSWWKMV